LTAEKKQNVVKVAICAQISKLKAATTWSHRSHYVETAFAWQIVAWTKPDVLGIVDDLLLSDAEQYF